MEEKNIAVFNPGFAPILRPSDKMAKVFIWTVSIIVFVAVALLSKVKLNVSLGFDPHLFALINAIINSAVSVLLLLGLLTVRRGNYRAHRRIMIAAILLSCLFLLSYICHHLFAGETRFGDADHDGLVTAAEKTAAGPIRLVYYSLLGTHIPLAGIILPFILFTAYRSLTGDYARHKKLARITFPVWLYVSITGVLVYWLISPYYH